MIIPLRARISIRIVNSHVNHRWSCLPSATISTTINRNDSAIEKKRFLKKRMKNFRGVFMYTLKLGQKRMVEKGWETKCEMGQTDPRKQKA